jgi:tetratricopeptide (TPR) repeat protein
LLLLLLPIILNRCDSKSDRSPEELELIGSIDSLSTSLSREMKYDSLAILKLERFIRMSDSLDYLKGVTELAINGSRICILNFRNEKSLELLEIAEDAMKSSGDPRLEAMVNLQYGFFNFRLNNNDAALDHYLKAVELSGQAQDTAILTKALMNIANVYLESEYLDKAREYFKKSIALNTLIKDYENLSIDYHRMSIYHLKKGELDSAGYYLETELTTSKLSKNVLLYTYNLNNMASFQIAAGALDQGERYAREALRLMDSISTFFSPNSSKSVIYANLGLISQKRQDYQTALKFFDLAYADSLYNLDMGYRINLLSQLIQTHRHLGNHLQAYDYLEKYLKMRDDHDQVVARQNLLDMEMRYDVQQVKNENAHKQSRMQILFFATVIGLGLGLFSLMLFLQKQRIKMKNVSLHRDIQEFKLDRLNRELTSQALFIAKNNERRVHLVKSLKDKLPDFKVDHQDILSGIINELSHETNDQAWKDFEMRFTEVHSDFYKKLGKVNPNLTFNEKRLCAFLLLDMTTKEISSITGQTIRAIQQARIRLRKQLNLTNTSTSLTDFLNSL